MDFDLNAFSKDKNYIIKASAGTGKTYSIKKMVRELILKDVPLKDLLIVTYTEKAAGELKDRIRGEINDVIDKVGGYYTKETLNIDDAFIGTIHSFCKSVIDEFGISAKLPLDIKLIDKLEIDVFLNDYIRKGEILNDICFLKTKSNIDTDSLIRWFKEALNKYYLNNNYKENKEIVSIDIPKLDIENYDIAQIAMSYLTIEELEFVIPSLFAQYKALRDSLNDKARRLAAILNTGIHSNYAFRLKTDSKTGEEGFPDSAFKSLPYEYTAYKYFLDRREGFDSRKVLVCKYLEKIYISWQEYKEKNKLQTFDDMIRNVLEAINVDGSVLLDKLKQKYKYGIIDEFQDTNQKQYIIFKKIFLNDDEHHLIVVGDKKQSIYSFQGADVKVFEKAVEEMKDSGAENTELSKNHRSSESMVDSCNTLFELDSYGFGGDFAISKSLLPTDKDWFNALYKGKTIKSFYINNGSCKPEFFPQLVANQIIDFCSYQDAEHTNLQLIVKNDGEMQDPANVGFKDFAVLARTRSEMRYICKTFERLGIPYIKYKDNSLFSSNECYHWVTLLEAIAIIDFTGYNRNAFKKVLFTDFFELPLSSIINPKYDRDDSDEIKLINKWKNLAFERKWEELISSIIYQSNLIKNLKSLSRMQSLIVYKQIADYCIDFLNKNNSIDLLIVALKKLSNGASSEDDEDGAIVAKGTEFNAVSVMTIHASKGLEFPIVIAVAGFAGANTHAPKLYCNHDAGDPKITFDTKIGTADEEKELRRLFYVCYTRAKYALFLPHYDNYKSSKRIIEKPIKELIDKNVSQDFPATFETIDVLKKRVLEILKKQNKIIADDPSLVERNSKELIKNRKENLTYKHSYSSLAHGNEEEKDDMLFDDEENIDKERDVEVEAMEFNDNGVAVASKYDISVPVKDLSILPKGKYVGNALHELFEVSDFTKDVSTIDDAFIESIFNKQKISFKDKKAYKAVKDIMKDTLAAQIPEIQGNRVIEGQYFTLSSITNDNKKAEIEFNFNMIKKKLSNYCNGFMDLVIKRGNIYSVLDYKTDSLNYDFTPFADIVTLKAQVDARYTIQRVLYSYTLIQYLSTLFNKKPEVVFNDNFGGVHYVFLRGTAKGTGNGIYSHTWESYSDLKKAYDDILAANDIITEDK